MKMMCFAFPIPSCRPSATRFATAARRHSFLVAILAALPVTAQESPPAEPGDRVTLLVNEGSGRITVTGRVADYTGQVISIQPRVGGTVRDYEASLVVDVQTTQLPTHVEGMERFRKREFEKARQSFEDALNLEERPWVRREILAMLVRCALREGEKASAAARFLVLTRGDPETRHWGIAPLDWGTSEPTAELRTAARTWRQQKTDAGRLFSASYLLFDPRAGIDPQLELRELATQTSPNISAMARAQLWRKRLADGGFTHDELRSWHTQILEMKGPLRGGPFYVLGTAHRRFKEHNQAAACLMWVPALMADDPILASTAQRDAADSLAAIGQRVEARLLYEEIVDRFAETSAASEASEALKLLER